MEEGKKQKRLIPIIGVIVAVVAIAIVLAVVLKGGPEKVVKKYVRVISELDVTKAIETIDFIGAATWQFDEEDFSEEDYEDFLKEYEELEKEYKEDIEEQIKEHKEELEEIFEYSKEEFITHEIKIKKIDSTKKLGKDLFLVDTVLEMKSEEYDDVGEFELETQEVTFIIYKNKVIYDDGLLIY